MRVTPERVRGCRSRVRSMPVGEDAPGGREARRTTPPWLSSGLRRLKTAGLYVLVCVVSFVAVVVLFSVAENLWLGR